MCSIKAKHVDTGDEYIIVGFVCREKFSLDAVIINPEGGFKYLDVSELICEDESLFSKYKSDG